jgi:hypothetical protein
MKKFSIIALLAVAALALPLTTRAGPITHNGYTLDEGTHIVSGGGLEWLQWDQTLGRSVDDVITDPLFAGWRLANNNEMASLFNAFTLGATPWDTDPTTEQIQETAWDSSEVSSFNNFMSLFSLTYNSTALGLTTRSVEDPLHATLAWYGDGYPISSGSTTGLDTRVGKAAVRDDLVIINTGTRDGPKVALAMMNRTNPKDSCCDTYISSMAEEFTGVALVRVSVVPEPSSFAIFLLGMIGLASRGFKKRS